MYRPCDEPHPSQGGCQARSQGPTVGIGAEAVPAATSQSPCLSFPPLLPCTGLVLGIGSFYSCSGLGTSVGPHSHRPTGLPSTSRLSSTWPQFTCLASSGVSYVPSALVKVSWLLFLSWNAPLCFPALVPVLTPGPRGPVLVILMYRHVPPAWFLLFFFFLS